MPAARPRARALAASSATIPKPLSEHPGNIFLAGEEVVVPLPGDWSGPWRVLDYDGKQITEGNGRGKINLGKLPVGYYEIPREQGKPPIGIGVLAPLAVPTPKTSPIGVDTALPWSFGNKLPEAANLCALAGINWARGRYNWMEMEPKQGEFAPSNKYDAAARELNKAGIQVLQVNGLTPSWAGQQKNRFPADLRDAYRFHREMARRWKGQVQAFEPWNEADWIQFGGHTGAEMASFQKACYWGLKAGNPDVIVCQNVFANYFPEVIADFHDNQAWPYLDTLNFHHYWPMDGLPKYYAQFREISGGRPMWVTECNFYHGELGNGVGADPKTAEFTADGLRRQAAQVPQVLTISLQNGSAAAFWFILPNFHEGTTQFGVLRDDLTPRPSYLALAAVGRLLADARPVGRLKSANKDFWGYLFRAKPDGKEQLVLVGWSVRGTETIQVPTMPSALFDTIGRERKPAGARLEISTAPVLALFPVGLQNQFEYEPAPSMPPLAERRPSPVVLQAVWPAESSKSKVSWRPDSQYVVGSEGPERMPIFVYNFAETEVKGRLTVAGPKDWNLGISPDATVGPLGRVELALTYDSSKAARRTREVVKIEGDFGPAGKSLLSMRLFPRVPGDSPSASLPSNTPSQPGPQTLYTGDFGGRGIFKIAPDGTSRVFYQGEGSGGGLAFDKSGNLYTVHGAKIAKVTPDGKNTTFASGFKNALGLTVDSLGNVYCTEYQNKTGAVYKFTPAGTKSTVESGLTWPYSLSSDANGNIYLSVLGHDVTKYTQTGEKRCMGPLCGWGRNAILDSQGSFYTLGFNITKVANGQSIGMFAPGIDFNHAVGLALDNSGNLYQSNCGETGEENTIKKEGIIFKYTQDGKRAIFSRPACAQPFWLAFYPPTIVPSPLNNASTDRAPTPPPPAKLHPPAPGSHVNAKDGAEMVLVPAGEFMMGADPAADSEERKAVNAPKHSVTLEKYWIYKYDVTVAQYRKFCSETGRAMPAEPSWGWRDDHPIVNVSWEDADKYVKWAGASLPTEAQWEKAARGTDGHAFPWGNEWDPKRCVHSNKVWGDKKATEAVGSHTNGVSPYGVMDMAGNVWNWCSDWFAEDYYKTSPASNPTGALGYVDTPKGRNWSLFRTVRGGAWCLCDPKDFRTTNRDWASYPDYKGNDVGFRCVLNKH